MNARLSQKRKHELVNDDHDHFPEISTLNDLIRLSNRRTLRFPFINTKMLWNIRPHLIELNSLIGMESVKETVFSQVIYYLQGLHTRDTEGEYLHTQIIGPPGTGKTTLALIIANIFKELKILKSAGRVNIAHRDDFVAGYVGQTALKTRKLLNDSIGGVLFFDEAYSLGGEDTDVFAKEAIDTMTTFLSEHKEDFCFIIAGYEDDIKKYFFGLNKGLERRFPWKHKIEPYKSNELTLIALKKIKDIKWECDVAEKELFDIIDSNKEYFTNAGGDVETFISKCKIAHSKRVFMLPADCKFKFVVDDFLNGVKMMKENSHKAITNEALFSMYS